MAFIIPLPTFRSEQNVKYATTHIFVQTSIFLAYGFKPDDLTSRESHDKIYMVCCFGGLIYVVAKTMPFSEENLGKMLRLEHVSAAV